MHMNYTAEQIGEMNDRNENFRGTRANFAKMQLFQEIRSDLLDFLSGCDEVRLVDGYSPNGNEKNSILWLDLSSIATLSKEDTAALTLIMNKADSTTISAVEDHVRITFYVNNVWDD